MKTNRFLPFLFLPLALSLKTASFAQSLPVGTYSGAGEDYYRRAQLMGLLDSSISFSARPLLRSTLQKAGRTGEVTAGDSIFFGRVRGSKLFSYSILPVSVTTQIDTKHPYAWNDGAMIPARGFQSLVSLGAYVKFGPLSVQLKPEYVYAQNKAFEGFSEKHSDVVWRNYAGEQTLIDVPEKFGDGSYSRWFLGQSSIRLSYGPVSAGLSNENLWWGPGVRNSLIMTNNAPGFRHYTINTTKPVRTPIGSFEGQLIGGRLEESGYSPALPERTITGLVYPEKSQRWRYLNGITINYQPKWVPGLFVGFSRATQMYHQDVDGLTDYLSVFNSIQKKNTGKEGAAEDDKIRDQLASVYVRWVWPEAMAEVYGEYGRCDFPYDLRDLTIETSHTAAYLLGIKKLINSGAVNMVQVGLEITQLYQPRNSNRAVPSWYNNGQVRQGYTHEGQILGAGIGKGSNIQSLDVSWIKAKGVKRIGLLVERYVHDNDFHNVAIKDIRSNWVDLAATGYSEWNYRNFFFNAKLTYINSFNYQWYYEKTDEEAEFWSPGIKTRNVHAQIGASYRF